MNEENQINAERAQKAYDESSRELEVRGRCYPKWVAEGRLSRSDATARYAAQEDVVRILGNHPHVTVNIDDNSPEWCPSVQNHISKGIGGL